MKKRILSSIAATLMASSVLFTTAFAAQDEGNGNDIEMRVAVSNSLQNAGNSDTLAEEYLPLYTKAGTKLGYLIPLEREGMCNGYIISMVKDNMYQTLTIAEGPVNADTVAILKDSMNNGNIIYDFPFNFYIYGDDNEPLVLTDNNRLLQVEDMEAVCYNDDHSVDLDQYMYLLCSDNIQPVADIEIASLTKWQQGSFVNVGSYYGGYQDWLHSQLSGARQVSQFYADRACGVAAANNVAIYLAQNMSGKSNLYNKGSLTLSGQGDTRFCTTDLRFCVVTVTWRTPVRRVPVPCRIANLRCRTPLDLNRRILAAGKATDGGVLDVRRLTLTPPAVKRRWLRRVCPCPLRVPLLIVQKT